jgi:serine/threonine protein kinase
MVGLEMLDRLEQVHGKSIVHRDLKPDNFLTGTDASDRAIYIIDFGLSKKYWSK